MCWVRFDLVCVRVLGWWGTLARTGLGEMEVKGISHVISRGQEKGTRSGRNVALASVQSM